MALARVTTWVAGQVLTAAALNSEFDNILNNPITLISPTTGPINFNLAAHTNLVITALSATSGSTGQALLISTAGTPIWSSTGSTGVFTNFTSFSSGQIPVGTSSGALSPITIGTTGQVLSVTSSNSNPVWGVIPLSGGLTSGNPGSGALFYVSTSGVLTPLGIGTSGQVLTVSTAPLPGWATPAAGGGGILGSNTVYSSTLVLFDEFVSMTTDTNPVSGMHRYLALGPAAGVSSSMAGGVLLMPTNNTTGGFLLDFSTGGNGLFAFSASLNPDVMFRAAIRTTSTGAVFRLGMIDSTAPGAWTSDPVNGIYWRVAGSSTFTLVTRSGGVETVVATTLVATSSFKPVTLRYQVTGTGTSVSAFTNGVLAASTATTNIPSTALAFGFGTNSATNNVLAIDAWQVIQDRTQAPF